MTTLPLVTCRGQSTGTFSNKQAHRSTIVLCPLHPGCCLWLRIPPMWPMPPLPKNPPPHPIPLSVTTKTTRAQRPESLRLPLGCHSVDTRQTPCTLTDPPVTATTHLQIAMTMATGSPGCTGSWDCSVSLLLDLSSHSSSTCVAARPA